MSVLAVGTGGGELVRQEVDVISQLIDREIRHDNLARILGPALTELIERHRLPRLVVIRLALLSDCLRAADWALDADGRISPGEVDFVFPIAYTIASFLGQLRDSYRPLVPLTHESLPAFLQLYRRDAGLFGGAARDRGWQGFGLCKRVAAETGDSEALEQFERVAMRVMDEIIQIDGISAAEVEQRARFREELRRQLEESEGSAVELGEDLRAAAFCDPAGPSVFSAIAHAHQVFERDPFDVLEVHADARDAFERLVDQVTGPAQGVGRILLVLGESGSGKTHLMRAFRNHVHGQQLGYAAYMQLTSRTEDYSSYALTNLIDSLERPYDLPEVDASGLMVLSDTLAEVDGVLDPEEIEQLREGDIDPERLHGEMMGGLVDRLLRVPRLEHFHPDLLRALLYLQRRDAPIKARVLKYLRCEHLSAYDRKLLGDIAPRHDASSAQRTLEELGKLMWAGNDGAMVLLIDQLEDIYHLDDVGNRFTRALDVVRHLVSAVPSAVVVISCLGDLYTDLKQHLTRSLLDRLERDPDPVRLSSQRSLDEVESIVVRRLRYLYDSLEVGFRDEDPLFPFSRADLERLANLRTRDILDWCRQYHERCIAAGALVAADDVETRPTSATTAVAPPDLLRLTQAWNDFRTEHSAEPPEDDESLLELLAEAVGAINEDLQTQLCAQQQGGPWLEVSGPGIGELPLAIGICNKGPQGGGLGRQIDALREQVGQRLLALVRSSDYPKSPRSRIAQQLGEHLRAGGRRVVVENADWRTLQSFRAFRERHRESASYLPWVRSEHPISQIRALRELFGIDELKLAAPPPAPEPEVAPAPTPRRAPARKTYPPTPLATPPPRPSSSALRLGQAAGLRAEPVELPLGKLTTHAGVLGTTGSGKTTLALNIVEQVLERDIPVVLFDRKGDLAAYARSDWWREPGADDDSTARKRRLAERVEVALYTPGEPGGRPLAISPIPDLSGLSSRERDTQARYAATALGAMMNFGSSPTDQTRRTILTKAIELISQLRPEPSLEDVVALIDSEDAALVNALGRLGTKHCAGLVERIETLRLSRGHLLADDATPLDLDALFTRTPGRARLSIISTKFLVDATDFWVARFLVEVGRWASKKGRDPASELSALLMFDEADLYMPAGNSKPATKAPMQDLLKRARSAGIGILLATQSPGDLDYRSRDNIGSWFLGSIADRRAQDKMKPLLSEARVNVSGRLARQKTGEFMMLSAGQVTELRADRSLMKTDQLSEPEIAELARRSAAPG